MAQAFQSQMLRFQSQTAELMLVCEAAVAAMVNACLLDLYRVEETPPAVAQEAL